LILQQSSLIQRSVTCSSELIARKIHCNKEAV
jgi:hypothetical protein